MEPVDELYVYFCPAVYIQFVHVCVEYMWLCVCLYTRLPDTKRKRCQIPHDICHSTSMSSRQPLKAKGSGSMQTSDAVLHTDTLLFWQLYIKKIKRSVIKLYITHAF